GASEVHLAGRPGQEPQLVGLQDEARLDQLEEEAVEELPFTFQDRCDVLHPSNHRPVGPFGERSSRRNPSLAVIWVSVSAGDPSGRRAGQPLRTARSSSWILPLVAGPLAPSGVTSTRRSVTRRAGSGRMIGMGARSYSSAFGSNMASPRPVATRT